MNLTWLFTPTPKHGLRAESASRDLQPVLVASVLGAAVLTVVLASCAFRAGAVTFAPQAPPSDTPALTAPMPTGPLPTPTGPLPTPTGPLPSGALAPIAPKVAPAATPTPPAPALPWPTEWLPSPSAWPPAPG